ncbi:MFS transporter permease [Bacillus manliponensis]|uniref:MFS transporter permease n=1 Tax=Bacillus manliponensis TaxID=574376 RepID=A0A073JUP7_9BACI|nr:MFS transporter [Bacillus manliponensis]KEK18015.1 MFS transporter permease [Bacillus manliponensis]
MDPKRVIFYSMIICYSGFGVINPLLAPLIREVGLDERHAGWMVSIAALVLLVAAPVWGRLSDRHGRKNIILIGFLGFSFSLALFASISWIGMEQRINVTIIFLLLMLSRILFGFFFPAMISSSQALMADLTDIQERSAGMGMIGAATGIGFIMGPAMGAILSGVHLVFPIFISSVLALLAMFFVYKKIPKLKPNIRDKKTKIDFRRAGLRPYLIVCISVMSIFMTLQIVGGFYVQDTFGLSTTETAIWLGVCLFIVGFMMALVQMTFVQKRQFMPLTLLRIGLPLFIIGLLSLIFINHLAGFAFAYMAIGAGSGFVIPGYTAGISIAAGKEAQGEAGGLTAAASGIASLIVPIASTSLYRMEALLPFYIGAVIIVLLLLYVWSGHKGLILEEIELQAVK